MNFSPEICHKAQSIIDERRRNAQNTLERHNYDIDMNYPDIRLAQKTLSKTMADLGMSILRRDRDTNDVIAEIRKNNEAAMDSFKALLKAHGLPENYLDAQYICDICEDTGFRTDNGDRCNCFYDIASRLSMESLNSSANMPNCDFEHFSLDYYSKEPVSKRPDETPVSDYERMSNVLRYCKRYADEFSSDSPSLIFYGGTGLGKTHLSLSIAKTVILKGHTCVYGSAIDFINEIEKEHFKKGDSDKNTLAELLEPELLIIDDLGSENRTTFSETMLYSLINSRMNLGKPTIASTNLSSSELGGRYNERIVSRIFGYYKKIPFHGKDIRIQKSLRK